jgi:hypothetical protein
MRGDLFDNGIGDFFVSEEQKKINTSMLADAELQRKQNEILIEYLKNKKVGSSAITSNTGNQKYIILGGVALVMVFAIIMTT